MIFSFSSTKTLMRVNNISPFTTQFQAGAFKNLTSTPVAYYTLSLIQRYDKQEAHEPQRSPELTAVS